MISQDDNKEELEPKVEEAEAAEKDIKTDIPKAEEISSLSQFIKEQATEGDEPLTKNLSLNKILGGDILNTRIIRNQIWVVLLATFFICIYIANRYSVQKDLIEIDKLQKELTDAKYRALSGNSEITERSRESKILEILKNKKDSVLKIASQPPYIIQVPDNE